MKVLLNGLVLVGALVIGTNQAPVLAQGQGAAFVALASGSQAIVVAQVDSVKPLWLENERGDRIIVSRLLLRVEETLKGEAAGLQWMDLPGGTIDGLTLHVSSVPTLSLCDRAVFFLEHRGSQALWSPRQNGQGILLLDENDTVRGTSLRLDDVRAVAGNGN